MLDPGDVVVFAFPGAVDNKRRPAVVISTALYQTHRPDVRFIGKLSDRDWQGVQACLRLALALT